MIIDAPVVQGKKKDKPKQSKSFLNDCLASSMRELVFTEDGRQVTKAQAITERVVNIAMFAQSNTDALSAAKFIFERLGGKPAVMKDEELKPMPMIQFSLNTRGYENLQKAESYKEPQEPEFNSDNYLKNILKGAENE